MKPRKLYTADFKARALELAQLGKPIPQVAEELGLSSDLIYRWRRTTASSGLFQASPLHFNFESKL